MHTQTQAQALVQITNTLLYYQGYSLLSLELWYIPEAQIATCRHFSQVFYVSGICSLTEKCRKWITVTCKIILTLHHNPPRFESQKA